MLILIPVRAALILSAMSLALIPTHAQDAVPDKPEKYPLRLHILAIDDTHPTVRLQPNWCSGSVPAMGGDTGGGDQGGGCGGGPPIFGGDDDFSGAGRADLVSPPAGTAAITFTYEGCSRVRVPPGFTSLSARWKKPGKLEVLLPTDALGGAATQKCTLTATQHEFVFLRMRNGTILKVTQEAYFAKPALRVFLSGGSESLQARTSQTVSVKKLMTSPE